MAKFKFPSGHIIKVDDIDAHLLRTHVFIVHITPAKQPVVRLRYKYNKPTLISDTHLSHIITECPSGSFVFHKNGNPLDYTRKNLEVLPRKEALNKLAKNMRITRALNKLVDSSL